MKNGILTHKELQMGIFMSFADAFCNLSMIPKGYFLTWKSCTEAFHFELWKSASVPEAGDAEQLLTHKINKGEYQMNDFRIGVMVAFLRENAQLFVKKIDNYFIEKHKTEFQN